MKITDRIILKTIDGKVVVRPIADELNCTVEFDKTLLYLDKKGMEAWNNGEEIRWWHGVWMDKKCLALLD